MERDFYALGREIAGGVRPEGSVTGRSAARQIRLALRQLRVLRNRLAVEDNSGLQAAEWLLDNWYVAQREGRQSERCLKKTRRLRVVCQEDVRVLYVFWLCTALLRREKELSEEDIRRFLTGVQEVQPLCERELACFYPALRGAVVLQISACCRLMHQGQDARIAQELEGSFTLLRTLNKPGMWKLLEQSSLVEQILSRDPAGEYRDMDDESRMRYRQGVCALAKKHGLSEVMAAQKILDLAEHGDRGERHVGWYIFRMPLGAAPKQARGGAYICGIILPTIALALLLAVWLHSWIVALLLVLPLSDIIKNIIDFSVVHLVRPRPVNRMRLKDGIPAQGTTLCVIAGLLTDAESGASYAAMLERYRLANRGAGAQLLLGLLADLPDRKNPMNSADRRNVAQAARAVAALNETYGGGFYLFFREPKFQTVDEKYQGWERKRGALLELCRLLRKKSSGLRVESGDTRQLRKVKYIITLDSDTNLTVGSAREMVGAMLHPLNRPVLDLRRNIVTSGYGLLQPRVSVGLGAANRSQFSRIFAGQGGVDPYGGACSDVYHDLFDQGTFTGKGIFDVDVFLRCLDGRFPENRILSHDLLEGAYLRAGLLGEVELTDGYPYKVPSYFARLHRWIRGDWQLLPWLGRRVRNQAGIAEENPVTPMTKWKIFDNLRRSVAPVCMLLAVVLGMCLHGTDFGVAAGVAILAAASNLLLSGAELAARRGAGLRARYHSTIITGFGGVILQTIMQLLFLPYQAWISFSAMVTALWRSYVSHRNLLAWVTAADAERSTGDHILSHYRTQWPVVVVGGLCIVFSDLPVGAAVGLIWILSPLFSWLLSRPIQEQKSISVSDRALLLHEGAQIWGYFADFLRPEDHWLPPDNWQEQPPVGLARRTSPTNIGMALLCCMAAGDLDFISRREAVCLISHMLDTMEALPKWKGHFYNWYNTEDLTALHPSYISTVDGGNLCGCLIALREGLYEWGEGALARRAEALSDGMDFSCLYDGERRLFYIGYDLEREAYTEGWYDLMASEARQTSYIAVARGEVEPRHWRQLSRTLFGDNDYSGLASWTGTMFEYFMPNLLMPLEQNSLLYESLSFCVYEQTRRTAPKRLPWGISESAFYAFDSGMNYQYKAHGVQGLGLKRNLDDELVVAPYATFLALVVAPGSAAKNLRRLRSICGEGKYGLYEAVDFTPSRMGGRRGFEVIRSYMSHHLGMSLVAIDNALSDNIMQTRFMRDCDMGAYRELLQERVPVGAAVLKNPQQEVQERPRRYAQAGFGREGTWDGSARPEYHLMSNGQCHILCRSDGGSHMKWRDLEITGGEGVRFFAVSRDSFYTLEPERWRFDGGAAWSGAEHGLSVTKLLRMDEQSPGEIWDITLRWDGKAAFQGELICYLAPVLARKQDFDAHPAFSKLFLESVYTGDGILFTRRPRKQGEATPALAAVWGPAQAFFDTDRVLALGRGGLSAIRQALRKPAQTSLGAVLDPCLLLRLPAYLSPGETKSFRLVLTPGETGDDALAAARRLWHQKRVEEGNGLARKMELCNLTAEDLQETFTLLKQLANPVKKPKYEQSTLWQYGISGDYPIAVLSLDSIEATQSIPLWLGSHKLLVGGGFLFDLVLLLDEGGDYRRPIRSEILEQMKKIRWEGKLGGRAGVHVLDGGAAVEEAATVVIGGEAAPEPPAPTARRPFTLQEGVPLWSTGADGSFQIDVDGKLPPLGWSQMLTNGRFGWMPDETGCGHLWMENSHENQLTPWCNDPLQIGGPERFLIAGEGGAYSLFADADGVACTVTYGAGFARWEKAMEGRRITVTAFVPMEGAQRVLLLEPEGNPCTLIHQTEGGEETRYPLTEAVALITTVEGTQTADAKEYKKTLNQTVMYWNRAVSSLKVYTGNELLDHYLNGWALYQVIACRLLGRTSRYQNGGAYGFRDQLQDVCATLLLGGSYAKGQLLRACAHQFSEGDVQHWWHEPDGKGVRTRITDDLLWLPYTLLQYLEKWDDRDILEETAPYLDSPPLREQEEERYEQPGISQEMGSVYDHAVRAIECVLARGNGVHGLLLMGTGDWNDGMNRVGVKGRGESVWLTWFASHVLEHFAPLCKERGEEERGEQYLAAAEALCHAANEAWDGDWFLRGYYDNGAPLGGKTCDECCIDSIAQSWAAMATWSDKEKAGKGITQAWKRLWDKEHGVVALFTPPFEDGEQDPGYIRGYLPGVRENGGQYTHGAVWLAMGCFRMGMADVGYGILKHLLPGGHNPDIYKAEPYVLAADVYTNPGHMGRAGWSWYTGAAGWYYRVATEELLGIHLRKGRLFVEPNLPDTLPEFSVYWRAKGWSLRISVARGTPKTLLDGQESREGVLLSALEGEHQLEVWIP